MVRILQKLNNRINYNPEDNPAPSTEETPPSSEATPPEKPPAKVESEGKDDDHEVFIYPETGEAIKLTKEHKTKLVALGLKTLAERNKPKSEEKPKNEEEAEEKPKAAEDDKYVSKADLQKRENARILKNVNKIINKLEHAGDKERALNKVLTTISLNQAKGEDFDEEQLANDEFNYYSELRKTVEKTTGNVEKKKEDMKKMGKGVPSEKNSETEIPKMTKDSFRNGSLTKNVMKFMKEAATE